MRWVRALHYGNIDGVAGLPLASATALYAWGACAPWPPLASMGLTFLLSLGLAGVLAVRVRPRRALSWLSGLAGAAFLGLPVLGYAVTGIAPFTGVSQPFLAEAALVDAGFLFSALVLFGASVGLATRGRRPGSSPKPVSWNATSR